MFNRPLNPLRCGEARREAELSERPGARLAGLALLPMAALLAIALRLADVQLRLGDEYAAEFERTIERVEPIAARDGRILSADGQVLAEDVPQFRLFVQYRWLEEPPEPRWLRQQALSRLDRQARRDAARVGQEEQNVLERRAELWRQLARLSGVDPRQLARARRDVQRRVEQTYALVERRREEVQREQEAAGQPLLSTAPDGRAGLARVWPVIVQALTTPPQREAREPLVIREQLADHRLVADLPLDAAVEVEAHPERFPGTRVEMATRRVYPQGEAAAHLIGFRAPLDDEAISQRRREFPQGDPLDYQPGDRRGRSGLERSHERTLRGLRGERRLTFNRRGELLASTVVRQPRPGRDLPLALHLSLQQAAEDLLDEQLAARRLDELTGAPLPPPAGGALVALDVRTGGLLAAASAPRFDPRTIVERDAEAWHALRDDARQPLFHRAADMALPPGSVFKAVSALAFLDSGRLDPGHPFDCRGFLDHPDRLRCLVFRRFGTGHGEVGLVDALARSCNVYFFDNARRIGTAPLLDWASRFGLGEPTGIDLPREARGTLPARGSDPLQLAIGQSQVTATPLQVARLMAAIANGGRLVTPRLADVSGVGPATVREAAEDSAGAADESPLIPGLSDAALDWVQQGLERVVAHPQGTGYKTVRLSEVAIAGKTGTAEPGGGRPDHAWFAGYVPADRPRVAFVVVLEHAGSGGLAAGPVAREFVQALLALGLLGGQELSPPSAN